MKFNDIPCIKDKAYFIMTGIEGSWLWEACYPAVLEESFCKKFVETFLADYDIDDRPEIQEMIDCSYDEIMQNRAKRALEKAVK